MAGCTQPGHCCPHTISCTCPLRCRYKKHAGLDCYPPLQIVFATKTTNRGKLDSHCWFFDGFAYLLQPEICVLFDAGAWAAGAGAAPSGRGGRAAGCAVLHAAAPRDLQEPGRLRCHSSAAASQLLTPARPVPPPPIMPIAAGTKPMPMALRNCYAHFRRNPFCGALTGELRVERPYRNFLTTVQFMEWKVRPGLGGCW